MTDRIAVAIAILEAMACRAMTESERRGFLQSGDSATALLWADAALAAMTAQGMETEGGDAKQAPGESLTARSRSDAPKD